MNRDQALRLALVVERRARADANTWVVRLQEQARLVAHGRAAQVIEPHQKTPDPLRTALSREWYVRVFEDQVRKRIGADDPSIAVTATETEHVAECLRDGVAYRIHGPGGSLVLKPDGPQPVPGQNGYTNRTADEPGLPERSEEWHRGELQRLVHAQEERRAADEKMVAATWEQLTPDQRTAFAAYLHQQHGTTGPAAYPTADTPHKKAAKPPTYSAVDTGNRTPT